MNAEKNVFFCIDMKCFYASVECADRGLDPFETPLVVADASRGKGAICLAVSPKMKAMGVKNRCRLFEIPERIAYTAVMPRMQRYIDCAADIYAIYLDYFEAKDIHVYSIDEAFIDVTGYLTMYKSDAKSFAKFLLDEIQRRAHVPATCGIGTNLYLAKVALDITAKKNPSGIGYLDEELYQKTLWDHRPITDFWNVASGTAKRLARYGVHTMRGVARLPEELLYRVFGINAELLIDHAHGKESCTMADIKAYRGKSKSISSSQILFENYPKEKARIVIDEMTLAGCQTMMRQGVVTRNVSIFIGYANISAPAVTASVRMNETTNVYSVIRHYVLALFSENASESEPIRRLGLSFGNVLDKGFEAYDLFTDYQKIEREKKIEHTVLGLKDRFGRNAMLRAIDLEDGATAKTRNTLIGGHHE